MNAEEAAPGHYVPMMRIFDVFVRWFDIIPVGPCTDDLQSFEIRIRIWNAYNLASVLQGHISNVVTGMRSKYPSRLPVDPVACIPNAAYRPAGVRPCSKQMYCQIVCQNIVGSYDYAAFLGDESENFVCLSDRQFQEQCGRQCSMRVLPIINDIGVDIVFTA